MKIFIDIGHPAHVHYFKNFIKIMQNKGHDYFITAREKDISFDLLKKYNLKYKTRGSGGNSFIGKLIYIIKADYILYKFSKIFKPDIFLSFGSPYLAHVSKFLRKPHIAFSDTEHAKYEFMMLLPFKYKIFTPDSFLNHLGKNHYFFKGYMESCYLHPKYFRPNPKSLDYLNLKKNEKFIIVRFVSWNASHDYGHGGINHNQKLFIINKLSNYGKVFISSEDKLPDELEKYKLKIPPEKMHDILHYANLYLGESITMSTESVLLGTPSIVISSLPEMGVPRDLEKYKMSWWFKNFTNDIEVIIDKIFMTPASTFKKIKERIINENDDITDFMVKIIEKEYNIVK